jgi:uncharacterized protein YegJ (DUF2314 family)
MRSAYEVRPGPAAPGEGVAVVRLEMAEKAGDKGEAPFLRLVPPQGMRADVGVWLNRLLSDLVGSEQHVASIETGNAAMEDAHAAAVAELPRVQARFTAGFRSGEVLHVKYGFPTEDDGHEYMWVAVTTWEEGIIRGTIANDPKYRRDLRAGQTVDIPEDEVFDWMIAFADGRVEGAFTNQALQQRGGYSDDD